MSNLTLLFTLIVALSSCPKMDIKYTTRLINGSPHSIGVYFAAGGEFGSTYPDTTLPFSDRYVVAEIKKGATYRYDSGINWDQIFDQQLPADTLSIFVFHTDTLKNNSWTLIRSQNKILMRYDLSLQDFKNRNFTIVYP